MTFATLDRTRSEEETKVALWRWEVLVAAGVHHKTADRLAASESDLHRMVGAKAAGATDTQLLQIFAEPGRKKDSLA